MTWNNSSQCYNLVDCLLGHFMLDFRFDPEPLQFFFSCVYLFGYMYLQHKKENPQINVTKKTIYRFLFYWYEN